MKNNLQKCRFSNLKSITAKVFLMFAVFCYSQQLFAQFTDDFSDGDFVSDPLWSGNDSKFTVDSMRLRLNAPPETDVAYLCTRSTSINDATWEFLIQMDFNPSASNFTRIYLVSDKSDLTNALNGYFVQLGNSTDEVSLFRQDGTVSVRLIDGADGKTNLAELSIRVKVTRSIEGVWELFTDTGPTGNYAYEGSATDLKNTRAEFFGVYCNYTSTRSDKFHFDDFSVSGDIIPDTIPPEVTLLEVIAPQRLLVTFSETVDLETSTAVGNYHVDGIGNPAIASSEDGTLVDLTFDKSFDEDVMYTLLVSGVADNYGNIMKSTAKNFQLNPSSPARPKDVIISEIFPDPLPSIGLPEVEFVEILNRSDRSIDLEGWSLSDPSSTLKLTHTLLGPGEYLILTEDPSVFPNNIRSVGSTDFPSLNNSEDQLILSDKSGITIDSLHYTIDWYRDDQKEEGGWSLEIIDPNNDCAGIENWTASEHPAGGTPGAQNSVIASKPDRTAPMLLSAIPQSSVSIKVIFNERMQRDVPLPEYFEIEPHLGVKSTSFSTSSHVELLIELADELSNGIAYGLTVNMVTDCAGNLISEPFNNVLFGLTEEPSAADVVNNEILFDPRPGGVDFVEIVNSSDKFFNLKDWAIGHFGDDSITSARVITKDDLMFPPGAYLVFTENIAALIGDYPSAREAQIVEVPDLPSFNDDSGSVALVSASGILLDFFTYTKAMHSVFINDPEGVSLERIAFDGLTNDPQNWKSASTSSGYATPGYLNSNSGSEFAPNGGLIQVDPEVFVPVTGQPDFVMIHYEFDHGGYVANVTVWDAQGHQVKRLASGDVLGTKGAFRWDGDRDDGTKARVGYYAVCFEVFDETGDVRRYYNRVAVATRF